MKYNPKIDYLIAKYTYHNYLGIEDEREYRKVYFEKNKPKNKYQSFMVKVKKVLELIKKKDSDFNLGTICAVYRIISKNNIERIDDKKIKDYIEKIKSLSDRKSFHAYIEIIRDSIFPILNYEMAILIFNLIRIKYNQIPFIFYPHETKEINLLIQKNMDQEFIIMKMIQNGQKTEANNKKHPYISTEEVIEKILNLRGILKDNFGVTGLGIYGSFARYEASVYSDLDVLIEINEEKKKDKLIKNKIFNLLKNELGLYIDGIINEEKLKLYKNIKQELIKIF